MGAVRTIKRNGSRFYVSPDNPRVTVPGVTSIIDMLPQQYLRYWAAQTTAELAVDSLPFIQQMAEQDRDGAIDFLKRASDRYANIRSKIGSKAHDLFERMIRGERVGMLDLDVAPYRDQFASFLATVNPELVRAEDVAWSDEHEYAGSFDAILRVWLDDERRVTPDRSGKPYLIMTDWKTSKDTYPSVALQMSAYTHADRIISPDGVSEPMPHFDGAAVLHITPDGWAFKPVRTDDVVFEHFLSLRHTFVWVKELSREVIGKPLVSAGPIETGTQRRG